MNDQTTTLQKQIISASKSKKTLRIEGANSKYFLGNASSGEIVSTQEHNGIISYDASELVITVRSGTPLTKIKEALTENNQMLAFEPPSYDDGATIGGTIACNLSGPARPYYGAARDFVLGSKIINGKGEILEFGGQVMKNVAGYDASRLMSGAYGTLGLILNISLKVLPIPQSEITLKIELSPEHAIKTINQLSGSNLPISASCYLNNHLYIRLSSSTKNTKASADSICNTLNAQEIENSIVFWQAIREQEHEFFKTDQALWRLSIPATSQPLAIEGEQLIEWGGACRWIKTNTSAEKIREQITPVGGHATAYRNIPNNTDCFQAIDKNLMLLHTRLKESFDPHGILNPDRLYKGL